MSLRAFHLLFIALSIVLAAFLAAWAMGQYQVSHDVGVSGRRRRVAREPPAALAVYAVGVSAEDEAVVEHASDCCHHRRDRRRAPRGPGVPRVLRPERLADGRGRPTWASSSCSASPAPCSPAFACFFIYLMRRAKLARDAGPSRRDVSRQAVLNRTKGPS